jgi:hypothetical protein
MIRKMLVIAAAIAMPVSVIAISGVTAGAATKPPPDPAITCAVTATVTFASPGISNSGSVSTSKTSATMTSGESFSTKGSDGSCSGTAPNNTITTKSVKCAKKGTQPASNPACVPGEYGYGSWSNFETEGTASIQKALKSLSFTINGINYSSKTSSAADIGCAGGEVGFSVTGTISAPKADKGQSAVLDACLGTVTGTGLNSPHTFSNNIEGPGTVATATLDPATSTVEIDGGS